MIEASTTCNCSSRFLELIDPELAQRFVELQGQSYRGVATSYTAIHDMTTQERLRLFGEFMTNEFPASLGFSSKLDATAAWEANRRGPWA